MHITTQILDGPLPPHDPRLRPHVKADGGAPLHELSGAGAVIVFEGVVRRREEDRDIIALDYEAYEPMATQVLRQLAQRTLSQFELLSVDVEHSRGRVAVGQCSFRLIIRSRHRKEGLAAMDQFIDRMKQDVPIWKSAVYPQGGE